MALSTYSRKKQFIAPEVEALIKELTGFEEDEENYQKVSKFTYTNIIHHNFSTVDIDVVRKSMNGIIDKFKLRGFINRSQRLKNLVEKFISLESSKYPETVKWNILLLLLQLSFKPLIVSTDDLKENEEDLNSTIFKDDVNWSTYLKEGSEDFLCPSDDSDEEAALWASSSEEDDPEESAGSDQSAASPALEPEGFGCIPHPSQWGRKSPPPSKQEVLHKILLEGVEAEKWLLSNVQNSWWMDPTCNTVPTSRYSPAYTCEKWEKHVAPKTTNAQSPLEIQKLSEFCVLHEVLWMLHTPKDMAVFVTDTNGKFVVRPNISLPSLIQDSFCVSLTKLCPYFDMMRRLRQFEELVWAEENCDYPLPATYKAYCTALFSQLQPLLHLLGTLEDRLNAQDETMTLVSVMDELTPALNLLSYLHDIHTQGVTELHTKPNWVCATRLLSVLYRAVVEAVDHQHLNASLNLFMHSFHIYINIIDVWLSEGRLEDWANEFLVTRKNSVLEVMSYGEAMDECGVEPVPLLSRLVSVVRDAGRTIEVVSQLNKLADLRVAVQNKGCLYKEFSENVYSVLNKLKEQNVDELANPVNSEFASAKSSVNNILENQETEFDKENSIVEAQANGQSQDDVENKSEDTNLEKRESSNSEEEVANPDSDSSKDKEKQQKTRLDQQMCNRLCGLQVCKGEGEGEDKDPRWYLLALNGQTMYKQVMDKLLENPLLREGLQEFMDLPHRPPSPLETRSQTPIIADSVGMAGLMSMHGVLERQLDLIVTRHRLASRIVTDTLRTEHRLLQHFTVLRNVFFMESGNLAQAFYSFLFEEIEAGMFNNVFNLNVQLQLCVEEHYPGFGYYFNFIVQGTTTTRDVHRAISFISLEYRADWPISSVILEEAIDSYNKVFRFLLHIKYAHWTLRNIRFADLADSQAVLRCRRLQVLRHWLYHSINTLHSYFMGLVLRSFTQHLEQSIQTADSVHIIVQAHNKFLDEVKMHCLQDKKTHVETFIVKLLRLCGTLACSWRQEAQGCLTDQDIQALEKQYLMACNGLTYCLEAIAEEADPDNYLWELKCELACSLPDPYS